MDYGLQGRRVIVTGAGGGIGRGLVAGFVAQGARVAAVDRQAEALATLEGVEAEVCDLADEAQVAALAARLGARWGGVDVLVNNAGMEYPTPLDAAEPDANARWSRLLDNNVGSMQRLTRALRPWLGHGASVINQSSIWGLSAVAGFSAYVASKHAVIGLTRSLAWELGPAGIRVNAVCPGWVKTDTAMASLRVMAAESGQSEEAMLEQILAAQAVPELLTPADLAPTFLFLASDGARPITGQAIVVSHGEVMH